MNVNDSRLVIDKLVFPFVVCLNQECDLEHDFCRIAGKAKDTELLHLAVAPAFPFDLFLSGSHWGGLFASTSGSKRSDTRSKLLMDNEIPRYHYLKFPENELPELIIDFKHFFTVHRSVLYDNLSHRLCSLDDLFREKVSQRFSNYICRIGLPEHQITAGGAAPGGAC